jgi:teichuronic acid biosynthesis glycosyltransferase TuaG
MSDEILVSVIIPFYSNKIWLGEALASVVAQTEKKFEIILVNDGSKEKIEDIITSCHGKIKVINTENRGAANARNTGILESRGKYLAFLDSDDLWLPNKLEKQVQFMVLNNYKWSHTDYTKFDNDRTFVNYVSCNLRGNIFPKCLVWNPIATPCVMIDRETVVQHKLGFASGKKVGEDNFFWEQMGKIADLGHLNEALTGVRIHGNNIAYNAMLQLRGRGDLIMNIKSNKDTFRNFFTYFYLLLIIYFCKYSFQIVDKFANAIKIDIDKMQIVFKFLFGIAYINFRIIRLII